MSLNLFKYNYSLEKKEELDTYNYQSITSSGVGVTIVAATEIDTATTLTLDLSEYLPDDGYTYYCWFCVQANCLATAGSIIDIRLGSDVQSAQIQVAAFRNPAAGTYAPIVSGAAIIPIGPERIFYVINAAGMATATGSEIVRVRLCGYQRCKVNYYSDETV